MKLSEILKNIELKEVHADLDTDIGGISYDSRTTKEGDLFVAIVGFESDGHKYIPMAKEKGASVILCERAPECDVPYVLVSDSTVVANIDFADVFKFHEEKKFDIPYLLLDGTIQMPFLCPLQGYKLLS